MKPQRCAEVAGGKSELTLSRARSLVSDVVAGVHVRTDKQLERW